MLVEVRRRKDGRNLKGRILETDYGKDEWDSDQADME